MSTEAEMAQRVVAAARGWLGTPYRHQASVRGGGADCLGLVRGIWRDVIGPEPFAIPPYTRDWSEASGNEALMAAADLFLRRRETWPLVQGGVVLFRLRRGAVAKHLGVISQTANGPRFIHAYAGHGVVESTLSQPWQSRIAAQYQFPTGEK